MYFLFLKTILQTVQSAFCNVVLVAKRAGMIVGIEGYLNKEVSEPHFDLSKVDRMELL